MAENTQVTPQSSPSLMTSLSSFLGLIDQGAQIYTSVQERNDANEMIAQDTVKPETVVVQKSATDATVNKWILPVSIGAGVLILILVLVVIFKRR